MAKPDKESSYSAQGLLAVLALLASALVVQQLPLTSSRPDVTEKIARRTVAIQDVDARLWQDPFAAADQHREAGARPAVAGRCPGDGRPVHAMSHSRECFTEKFRSELAQAGRLIILPVMVFGGPYAEDAELRRRTRYAVLSALNVRRFRPDDEFHIGYVERDRAAAGRIVPFEWVTGRPSAPAVFPIRVLLLWLDETELSRDLLGDTARLLDSLGLCRRSWPEKGDKVDLRIIGPQGAAGLSTLNPEERAPTESAVKSCVPSARMYTVSTADRETWKLSMSPGKLRAPLPLADEITLWRAIMPDRKVVKALKTELALRGVSPGRDEIVIVAEWDSRYARLLRDDLKVALCEGSSYDWCASRIAYVSYMRGLDGVLPRPSGSQRARGDARSDDIEKESVPPEGPRSSERMERADGNAQLDYLRRLAATVRAEARTIKAIGLLGSDAYDKLLILQAMRDLHPEAVFFTTDLDARYLHPRESSWTRNLIVASSFGLQLAPEWQREAPPFRDNYQTAAFFATSLALCEWVDVCRDKSGHPGRTDQSTIEDDWLNPPRLFEIGRTTAVELGPSAPTVVHPGKPPRRALGWMLVAGVAAVVLVYFSSIQARNAVRLAIGIDDDAWPVTRRWWILVRVAAAGGVAAFAVIVALIVHHNEEPFTWFEGVSLWPTQLIRLAGAALAVGLVIRVWRQVDRVANRLTPVFFEGAHGRTGPPEPERTKVVQWFKTVFGTRVRDEDSETPFNPERGWNIYRSRISPRHRAIRVAILGVSFFALAVFINKWDRFPHVPYRGDASWYVDRLLLFGVCAPLIVCLIFLVADAVWLCQRFARDLSRDKPTAWPEETLKTFAARFGVPSPALERLIDVEFVAAWTGPLASIVYYPAVVLGMMIVARSSFFDRADTPWSLITVFVLSLGYTAVAALSLRAMAERNRRLALEALRAHRIVAVGVEGKEPQIKRVDLLIERVEALEEGAFAPLARQPFIRALLLPLSSAGSLALLEFLILRR